MQPEWDEFEISQRNILAAQIDVAALFRQFVGFGGPVFGVAEEINDAKENKEFAGIAGMRFFGLFKIVWIAAERKLNILGQFIGKQRRAGTESRRLYNCGNTTRSPHLQNDIGFGFFPRHFGWAIGEAGDDEWHYSGEEIEICSGRSSYVFQSGADGCVPNRNIINSFHSAIIQRLNKISA